MLGNGMHFVCVLSKVKWIAGCLPSNLMCPTLCLSWNYFGHQYASLIPHGQYGMIAIPYGQRYVRNICVCDLDMVLLSDGL